MVIGRISEKHWSQLLLIEAKRFGLFQYGDQEKRRLRYMKAKELDRKFDKGEDISKYLDITKARRPEII